MVALCRSLHNFKLMKAWLLPLGAVLIFAPMQEPLYAQAFGGEDALAVAFPFLSAAERTELKNDFMEALAQNPEIAAQWTTLLAQLEKPLSGSPTDIESLRLQIVDFEGKLRDAMQKDDPDIGSIMDKIDENMPKVHPELSPSLGSGGSTPSVPAVPSVPAPPGGTGSHW